MSITTKSAAKDQTRKRASTLALGATLGLMALKFYAAFATQSLSVLSEAIHSLLDVISAGVAFVTVRLAHSPPDPEHPFGHGKFETLSSLLESALLFVAGGWILWEAYRHLGQPEPLQAPRLGIIVMAVSLVVSYAVYRHNLKAARETDSLAIQANAYHFLADVLTSVGVLAGLALSALFEAPWIDPLVASGVALYILGIAIAQSKVQIQELAEASLPEFEIAEARAILNAQAGQFVEWRDLKTRKSGPNRFFDLRVIQCGLTTVRESHGVCDAIEDALKKRFPEAAISIHVEPCETVRSDCEKHCPKKHR